MAAPVVAHETVAAAHESTVVTFLHVAPMVPFLDHRHVPAHAAAMVGLHVPAVMRVLTDDGRRTVIWLHVPAAAHVPAAHVHAHAVHVPWVILDDRGCRLAVVGLHVAAHMVRVGVVVLDHLLHVATVVASTVVRFHVVAAPVVAAAVPETAVSESVMRHILFLNLVK
jgi:hypothetical protein